MFANFKPLNTLLDSIIAKIARTGYKAVEPIETIRNYYSLIANFFFQSIKNAGRNHSYTLCMIFIPVIFS